MVHNKSVLREDGKVFYISSGFPDIHHEVDVKFPAAAALVSINIMKVTRKRDRLYW